MKFLLFIIFSILNIIFFTLNIYSANIKNLEVKFNLANSNISLENQLTIHTQKISEYLNSNSEDDIDYLTHEAQLSFRKFLHSLGYFSAITKCNLSGNQILCDIKPGEYYTLKDIDINIIPYFKNTNPLVTLPFLENINLVIGEQIIAAKILNEQNKIQNFAEENNCLFHLNISHELFLDKNDNTGVLNYLVLAGTPSYINKITFNGLRRVKEDYAVNLTKLESNSCFKSLKIKTAKENLQKSGLFSSVEVILPKGQANDGGVDIGFNLTEQKPRTVKAGIKYTTDLGMALNGNLIHRNLSGHGEKLGTNLTISKQLQLLDTFYETPYFLKRDQKFNLQNVIKRENREAYLNNETFILARLEKKIFSYITIGGGIKYGVNKVIDDIISKKYAFFSFPLFVLYDITDDILDPKKGFITKFDLTPYVNSLNTKEKFLKYRISSSCYIPISKTNDTLIALRAIYGKIGRKNTLDIPINERFFAGGANSIRGYRYQTAGPLNLKRKPMGGSSILELSSELRFKINESIGFATFIDAGNVFNSAKQLSTNKKFFVSGGFGIRYYTSFGPIRADVAFPLQKRRRKVDNILQLYFSIGQAF